MQSSRNLQSAATLLAWVGNTDLRVSESADANDLEPILGALKALHFSDVHLLSDHNPQKTRSYVQWLAKQTGLPVFPHPVKLTSPTNFEEIFRAARSVIEEIQSTSPL